MKVTNINKNKTPTKEVIKTKLFGDAIDYEIKKAIQRGLPAKHVVMTLANRLGTFMTRFDSRERLWPYLRTIIKKAAGMK